MGSICPRQRVSVMSWPFTKFDENSILPVGVPKGLSPLPIMALNG